MVYEGGGESGPVVVRAPTSVVAYSDQYCSLRDQYWFGLRTTTGCYHPPLRVRTPDIVMQYLFTIFAVQTLRG